MKLPFTFRLKVWRKGLIEFIYKKLGISIQAGILDFLDDDDEVKIDIPDLPHITRSDPVNIPDDILKTLVCAVFMGCGSLATAFSIALVHERMPDYAPLPDAILDHVKYEEWGLAVSEYLIVTNMVLAAITVLLHHHRMVVFRRIFIILGLLYFYRSVTMYITGSVVNLTRNC